MSQPEQENIKFPWIQARKDWDLLPRSARLDWDEQYASMLANQIWDLYVSGSAFYTKEAIWDLEMQINNCNLAKQGQGVAQFTETYLIPGLDGEQHEFELPTGLAIDRRYNDMVLHYAPSVIRFASLQYLLFPKILNWDSRKTLLPMHIGNWCVRQGLPAHPVLPVDIRDIETGYHRKTPGAAVAEVDTSIQQIEQSTEWEALRNEMFQTGPQPLITDISKILIFIDSDMLQTGSKAAKRDMTLLAFAIVLANFVHKSTAEHQARLMTHPVPYNPALRPTIYVSESTYESPLPRDPSTRQFLQQLGIRILHSDSHMLSYVDDWSVVMECGMRSLPLRQVIADFFLHKQLGCSLSGPAMFVRPTLEDPLNDLMAPGSSNSHSDLGNLDAPRTRTMMEKYTPLKMPDPHKILENTSVYLRKPTSDPLQLAAAEPWNVGSPYVPQPQPTMSVGFAIATAATPTTALQHGGPPGFLTTTPTQPSSIPPHYYEGDMSSYFTDLLASPARNHATFDAAVGGGGAALHQTLSVPANPTRNTSEDSHCKGTCWDQTDQETSAGPESKYYNTDNDQDNQTRHGQVGGKLALMEE
ncbi:hypothetical protein VTK73DRAFT_6149 [Phialemonium thermophilum]|uniref:Uncharacterized protein n=1 Tax=Phialemonium thermophilum TaxID=223376 RepID=A0ABR3WKK0_9PEZI